jgi:hypothetical protein
MKVAITYRWEYGPVTRIVIICENHLKKRGTFCRNDEEVYFKKMAI